MYIYNLKDYFIESNFTNALLRAAESRESSLFRHRIDQYCNFHSTL